MLHGIKQRDYISNYLTKGSLIGVEGSIQSRTYDDATGKKVYVQEVNVGQVTVLESRTQRQEREQQSQPHESEKPSYESGDEPTLDITSDDLPFR
ncbi:single-stranded DNA-binding protein [Erysipelothrix sp. D19-032]